MNDAINNISGFSANYGGTDILYPLESVFKGHMHALYQKTIFLLTDGSVSNPDNIIKLIEKNCSDQKFRVFTIGIGNGCSSYLVTKSAKAGQGKHEFIPDQGDIEAKIISLLAKS